MVGQAAKGKNTRKENNEAMEKRIIYSRDDETATAVAGLTPASFHQNIKAGRG